MGKSKFFDQEKFMKNNAERKRMLEIKRKYGVDIRDIPEGGYIDTDLIVRELMDTKCELTETRIFNQMLVDTLTNIANTELSVNQSRIEAARVLNLLYGKVGRA